MTQSVNKKKDSKDVSIDKQINELKEEEPEKSETSKTKSKCWVK